jgi:hypothetical protein
LPNLLVVKKCADRIEQGFKTGVDKCVPKESPNMGIYKPYKDKGAGLGPPMAVRFIDCKDGVQSDLPVPGKPAAKEE